MPAFVGTVSAILPAGVLGKKKVLRNMRKGSRSLQRANGSTLISSHYTGGAEGKA